MASRSVFPSPFPLFFATDLQVFVGDQRQLGGFTVAGGEVVFTAPPPAGARVTLRRVMAIRRISEFQEGGAFRAKVVNGEFDYQTALVQQLAEEVGRSLRRTPSSGSAADLSLPEPQPRRALLWNGDGSGLVNSSHDPDLVGQFAAAAATDAATAEQAAAQAVGAASVASTCADEVVALAAAIGSPLGRGHNLSDLTDVAAARGNLGLGSAATRNVGVAPGELPAVGPEGTLPAAVVPVLIPAGAVMPYAGPTAPAGWLVCDGAAVSRTTYAALFAAIGIAHGAGDGSTTFHLPDLRGRVPIGAGQGSGLSNRSLGQKLGAETHTLAGSEIPAHSHGIGNTYNVEGSTYTGPHLGGSTPRNSGQSGGGGAHNNMQPSYGLTFIIKT